MAQTVLIKLKNSQEYAQLLKQQLSLNNNLIIQNHRDVDRKLEVDLAITQLSDVDDVEFNPCACSSTLSFFSSGTEGEPKLSSFRFSSLYAQAQDFVEFFKLNNSKFLIPIPLSSIGGFNLFLRGIAAGGDLRVTNSDFTEEQAEDSVISMFPSQLRRHAQPGILATAKCIFFGGEELDKRCQDLIVKHSINAYETYALTEVGGTVAYKKIGEEVFKAMPGVRFKLQKDRLCIRTKLLDWFETMDTARLVSSTEIRNIQRISSQIVRGGYKFSLKQVQEAVASHPEVIEVNVSKEEDPEWGENVVCRYVANEEIADFETWLAELLPSYMLPRVEFEASSGG